MDFNLFMEVVRTLAALVTCFGIVWLCAKVDYSTKKFFLSDDANEEARVITAVTVADSLLRIEESARDARIAAIRTEERINVATELGFQNAEANERLETTNADVAKNLVVAQATVDSVAENLTLAQSQVDAVAMALMVSDSKIAGVAHALVISDERVASVAAELKISKEVVALVAEDLKQAHLRAINIRGDAEPGRAADAAAQGPPPTLP